MKEENSSIKKFQTEVYNSSREEMIQFRELIESNNTRRDSHLSEIKKEIENLKEKTSSSSSSSSSSPTIQIENELTASLSDQISNLTKSLEGETSNRTALEDKVRKHQKHLTNWVEVFNKKWQKKLQNLPSEDTVVKIHNRIKAVESAVGKNASINQDRVPSYP